MSGGDCLKRHRLRRTFLIQRFPFLLDFNSFFVDFFSSGLFLFFSKEKVARNPIHRNQSMKRYKIIVSMSVVLSFLTLQYSNAATIADWTFESSGFTRISNVGISPLSTNIAPEIGSGSATGLHASSSTAWTSPSGNGSAHSIGANNWAVGDYFQFSVVTAGFTNINLSYDQTGSSTGPSKFYLEYSLEGSSFIVSGITNTVLLSTWTPATPVSGFTFSYDLSSITALSDDAASVYFRVVDAATTSIGNGTVGTSGADRIDNFIVSGTAVPEPSTMALAAVGGVACLLAVRRKR
jgi:hypothetical protein